MEDESLNLFTPYHVMTGVKLTELTMSELTFRQGLEMIM